MRKHKLQNPPLNVTTVTPVWSCLPPALPSRVLHTRVLFRHNPPLLPVILLLECMACFPLIRAVWRPFICSTQESTDFSSPLNPLNEAILSAFQSLFSIVGLVFALRRNCKLPTVIPCLQPCFICWSDGFFSSMWLVFKANRKVYKPLNLSRTVLIEP